MAIWDSFTNQKQWETYLKNLLRRNDHALIRATIIIYDNQTNDEKMGRISLEENKVGFSKKDAMTLSEVSEKLKAGLKPSQRDIAILRFRIPKYWKQLMIASKENIARKKREETERDLSIKQKRENPEVIMQCPCEYGICNECQEYYGQLKFDL